MNEWRWIDQRALLLLHDESIAEHGTAAGMRDEGLLDSALVAINGRRLVATQAEPFGCRPGAFTGASREGAPRPHAGGASAATRATANSANRAWAERRAGLQNRK